MNQIVTLYKELLLQRKTDASVFKIYDEIRNDIEITQDDLNEDLLRFLQVVKKYRKEEIKELLDKELIISLTSFPKRLNMLHKTLETLFNQTVRTDKVILWLAEEEFTDKDKEIPGIIKNYVKEGKLEIGWADINLRPHNKYYHSMHRYPDSIIVTVDDDLYYPADLVEKLYLSYLEYPRYVSASRVHLMLFDKEEKLIPYVKWIKETDYCIHKPAMQLFATGTGGVLYPPHIFDEKLNDYHVFNDFCPTADDYWLKVLELLCDVPVVLARKEASFDTTEGSQEITLLSVNVMRNGNDVQIDGVYRWIEDTYHEDMIAKKALHSDIGEYLNDPDTIIECLFRERKRWKLKNDAKIRVINKLEKELASIKNSRSYKLVRKIRKFLPK